MDVYHQEYYLYGKQPIIEALSANQNIDTIYIDALKTNRNYQKILMLAKEKKIPVKKISLQRLNEMTSFANHQGVAALSNGITYVSLTKLLDHISQLDKPSLIIITDGIQDPHNLGAIIRTAEALGASALIIPKRNHAALSPIVNKTSAGAVNHLSITRVSNISQTILTLKKHGFWIYGADMSGEPCQCTEFSKATVLVIGAEGSGLSNLVKKSCDQLLQIPMEGKINSLNASVAAAILMYEIRKQQNYKK